MRDTGALLLMSLCILDCTMDSIVFVVAYNNFCGLFCFLSKIHIKMHIVKFDNIFGYWEIVKFLDKLL